MTRDKLFAPKKLWSEEKGIIRLADTLCNSYDITGRKTFVEEMKKVIVL